jgi:Zn-dependent protease with chaperone function
MASTAPRLALDHFDGHTPRAQPAEIWLENGRLYLLAGDRSREYAMQQVRWPERQRHGQRQAQLPDGGLLSCADARQWDAWAAQSGLAESRTVRWMQSWRLAGLSLLLVLFCGGAIWRWGTPLAAEACLRALPASVDSSVGSSALGWLDEQLLKPSQLPATQQAAIAERFAAVASREPTAYRLHFRDGGKALGPNAFALPGGDIVLTDELVKLMADTPDAVSGVLAHELGHVQARHAMRMLVQSSLSAAWATLLFGDVSNVLAGASALVVEMSYSRDLEREADATAYRLMRKAGIPPRVMVVFFQRIDHDRPESSALPIAIASHPANAERIAFFSQ